jgi:hypothetical protein
MTMSLFSKQFLASYCFFSALVTARRKYWELPKGTLDGNTIADAFIKATHGMSRDEQKLLTEFAVNLIQIPEDYEED